jgi:DNA repair and recombination protein RAD54B
VVSAGYATLQDSTGKDLGKMLMNKKLELGDVISIGAKEVEIDSLLSKADYLAGRPFLRASKTGTVDDAPIAPVVLPMKGFKNPLLSTTILSKTNSKVPMPRHDPKAENALIMPRPSSRSVPV